MAAQVGIIFTGDPRGAVQATKTVEASLGSIKGATGDLERTTGTASGGIRRHWGAISLAAGGALAAIVAGGKQAGDAASNLGEQVNKTRTVFRGSEQDVLAWSKTTASSIGISQRAALEAAGTFGNMLVPMGIARKEAGGMSKSMVTLAADLASFNNASPEETLDALRSGLAGESEPLRRFGVFLNAARVEEEALRLGLVKQGDQLSASAKAQATYSLILKDSKDAQGDFARTSDSVANSERIKAAEFENTKAKLGQGLLPVMQLFNTVMTAGARFASEHATAVQVIVGVIAALAGAVIATNAAMAVYTTYTRLAAAASAAWTAVQWLLNAALTANPIGILVVALAALVAGLILAWRESETFRRIVSGAFEAIASAADAVLGFFRDHWKTIAVLISGPFAPLVLLATDAFGVRSALVGAFRAVKDFIGDRINDVVGFFTKLPGRLAATLSTLAENAIAPFKAVFTGAKNFVSDRVDEIVSFFRGLPQRLLGLVDNIKNAATSIGEGIFKGVTEALKTFGPVVSGILKAPINAVISAINAIRIPPFSIRIRVPFAPDISFSTPEIDPIPDIAQLARGVRGFAGGLALVGEQGPELLRLPRGSDVLPTSLLGGIGRSLAAGGVTNVVNVNVHADGFMIGNEGQLAERIASMIVPFLPDGHRVAAYRLPI